jgi:peptide-methionine (S)-S-oxide reductase
MGLFGRDKSEMPSPDVALPGRSETMPLPARHFVLDATLDGPFPDSAQKAVFGMGCFWGAERIFWSLPGVITTSVGYVGGFTPNPSYQEVCSGMTGHNEVVQVVFDTEVISFDEVLKVFWESHDPTQGMRQGNDQGTQYRSGVYYYDDAQRGAAEVSKAKFQAHLTVAGYGPITTEVVPLTDYYFAEDYHQQYLGKNPNGYCGIGGTGVSCPIGLAATDS